MAKVSARGATEVARLTKGPLTYVFTSDGRALYQVTYGDGQKTGYRVVARKLTGDRQQSYIDGMLRNGYCHA